MAGEAYRTAAGADAVAGESAAVGQIVDRAHCDAEQKRRLAGGQLLVVQFGHQRPSVSSGLRTPVARFMTCV